MKVKIFEADLVSIIETEFNQWLEGRRRNYTCISCYYFK